MIRSERSSQRGQSLPLVVLFLPVLLAFCALGIDVARLFVEQSSAQAAADLAALSGARLLPGSAASAQSQALAIATANGYTSGSATLVTATSPYSGDASRIEVTIHRTVTLMFMPVLGVNTMDISARSVAHHQPEVRGGPATIPYAIYAAASSCTAGNATYAISWTGDSGYVAGIIHSESGMKVPGNNNVWSGGTTYRCPGFFSNTGVNDVFTTPPTYSGTSIAWPATYTWDMFCSTGGDFYHANGKWDLATNGPWWVGGSKASLQLVPGVYCADGANAQLVLSTSDVTGNVTLVSNGTIAITGANFAFRAYSNSLAMAAFGTGTPALRTSGGSSAPTGVLYAPNGQVQFTGVNGAVYHGSVLALSVIISGTSFQVTADQPGPGTGPSPSPETLQLTE